MESLKQKVAVFLYDGIGYGSGSGYGSSSGYGSGYGASSGYGYGSGYGDGSGSGSGYGDGYGDGDGDGYGYDLVSSINHLPTAVVDGVLTAFSRVHGTVAKGYIVRGDLSMKPCYVVKSWALFAHGETLRDAMSALRDKMFEDMPEEDRIHAFMAEHKGGVAYPNADLFDWHHRLTGSCLMGRKAFVTDHDIDMDGSTTPEDFIRLTEHAFGGDVIRKLRGFYGMD